MGIDVVYFDSESAIDPSLLARLGIDLERFLYVQASSVEFVLETMEELLGTGNRWLFIWDSLALTPSVSEVEGDFNPNSEVGKKARILSKGMSKLVVPIANANAKLVIQKSPDSHIISENSKALALTNSIIPFFPKWLPLIS